MHRRCAALPWGAGLRPDLSSGAAAAPPANTPTWSVPCDLQNMFSLLGTHPSISDAPGAKALAAPAGGVSFQDVSFQARLILMSVMLGAILWCV